MRKGVRVRFSYSRKRFMHAAAGREGISKQPNQWWRHSFSEYVDAEQLPEEKRLHRDVSCVVRQFDIALEVAGRCACLRTMQAAGRPLGRINMQLQTRRNVIMFGDTFQEA